MIGDSCVCVCVCVSSVQWMMGNAVQCDVWCEYDGRPRTRFVTAPLCKLVTDHRPQLLFLFVIYIIIRKCSICHPEVLILNNW